MHTMMFYRLYDVPERSVPALSLIRPHIMVRAQQGAARVMAVQMLLAMLATCMPPLAAGASQPGGFGSQHFADASDIIHLHRHLLQSDTTSIASQTVIGRRTLLLCVRNVLLQKFTSPRGPHRRAQLSNIRTRRPHFLHASQELQIVEQQHCYFAIGLAAHASACSPELGLTMHHECSMVTARTMWVQELV